LGSLVPCLQPFLVLEGSWPLMSITSQGWCESEELRVGGHWGAENLDVESLCLLAVLGPSLSPDLQPGACGSGWQGPRGRAGVGWGGEDA
jgi:hypothetical protein